MIHIDNVMKCSISKPEKPNPPYKPNHLDMTCLDKCYHNLETEYRLFPPVTIFLDLFPCAGYFFNGSD